MRSINWRNNIEMAVEETILFALVEAIEQNMRGHGEGKIIMRADCWKVWKSLTYEKVKLSQFAGDRGSTRSKMIELETKTKVEVEHAYSKTKTVD